MTKRIHCICRQEAETPPADGDKTSDGKPAIELSAAAASGTATTSAASETYVPTNESF